MGRGGEGTLVRAVDRRHGRDVALKVRRVPSDPRDAERMLAESRTLLSLRPHAGLPLARDDFFEGDRHVLVMDWVDGIDLGEVLTEHGRPGLPPVHGVAVARSGRRGADPSAHDRAAGRARRRQTRQLDAHPHRCGRARRLRRLVDPGCAPTRRHAGLSGSRGGGGQRPDPVGRRLRVGRDCVRSADRAAAGGDPAVLGRHRPATGRLPRASAASGPGHQPDPPDRNARANSSRSCARAGTPSPCPPEC